MMTPPGWPCARFSGRGGGEEQADHLFLAARRSPAAQKITAVNELPMMNPISSAKTQSMPAFPKMLLDEKLDGLSVRL
jgi:hypothetical protein